MCNEDFSYICYEIKKKSVNTKEYFSGTSTTRSSPSEQTNRRLSKHDLPYSTFTYAGSNDDSLKKSRVFYNDKNLYNITSVFQEQAYAALGALIRYNTALLQTADICSLYICIV